MHDRPLTTAKAAEWLGYRTAAGVRRLVGLGELQPCGRGAKGVHLFDIAELARYARSRLPGALAPMHRPQHGDPAQTSRSRW